MTEQYGGTEFACPACGADSKFHRIAKRRAYACQHCGHHIYPCVGTPFEKSRTNLTKWFFAMYLMTSTRHGVAAKELERQLGCTYKTAWRMAHELRKLMAAPLTITRRYPVTSKWTRHSSAASSAPKIAANGERTRPSCSAWWSAATASCGLARSRIRR
jgi:transposase-like protein